MPLLWRGRPSVVKELDDAPSDDAEVGVVVRDLAAARRLHLPVAPSWVIRAELFRHLSRSQLPPAHDIGSLLRIIHRPRGRERAARARERILRLELDSETERELDRLWEEIREMGEAALLTASPNFDDVGLGRGAGVCLRALVARSREELGTQLREVWGSTVFESTLRYLRNCKIRDMAVAVVVQALPPAHGSGLFLTRRGLAASHGADRNRLVALAPGAEALLHPRNEPSSIVFFDSEGQPVERTSSEEDARMSEQLASPLQRFVVESGKRLDPLGPHELVFSITAGGEPLLYRFRSITRLGFPEGGDGSSRWTRLENEPRRVILTPLSRAFADWAARERRQMAVSASKGRASKGALGAHVQSACYLNVSALLAVRDARRPISDARLVELAGGQLVASTSFENERGLSLPRAGLITAQQSGELRRLREDVERFQREANQQRSWLAELDLAILPDDSLRTTLREGQQFFARAHALSLQCERALMASHGVLCHLLRRFGQDRSTSRAFAVTAGAADLETVDPGIAFAHVVAIARQDAVFGDWLRRHPDRWPPPAGPARRALQQFLDAYGDRGFCEIELSRPRWAEQPERVAALVAGALRADRVDPDHVLARARARADRDLAEIEMRASYVEARIIREVVTHQRELARLQARAFIRIAHSLSMLRTIAIDIDRRLRRVDEALAPDAAFFLTLGELTQAASGTRAEVSSLVGLRLAEREADQRGTQLPITFTATPELDAALPASLGRLEGIAVAPGVVVGRARRVGSNGEGLETLGAGDILVTGSLDAALAPWMFLAGAIVSELGNPLSVGAAVAREVGVPCVSGIPGAVTVLGDGALLRVDGNHGIVEKEK